MEDSDTLRTTTARLLKRAGYEVEAAKEGEGAVARYREARDAGRPFDAVILDLTVPGGMGGRETVRRLLEIDPDVRAIVSSGYPNDPAMIDPEMYGFRGVVPKPYAVQDMIAGLNRVLHTEK